MTNLHTTHNWLSDTDEEPVFSAPNPCEFIQLCFTGWLWSLSVTEVLGDWCLKGFLWVCSGPKHSPHAWQDFTYYDLHSLCLPATSEWIQHFYPLSFHRNGMNYVFWATLAAFEAILMYNVKKRETILKKFPCFNHFALARLLCGAVRFAKSNLYVTSIFFFNFKKRGYQRVLRQS